ERNDGGQQQRRHAGLLHVGGRTGVVAEKPDAFMQEDEDKQEPACEQAGIPYYVFRRAGHQLTFADFASAFSRSSRSSQPCGHSLVNTASCSRAFGRSPIST